MNLIPRNALTSFDSLFDDAFPSLFRITPQSRFDNPQLAVDIEETDTGYEIKADFPGVKKDDIQVSIDDKVLTISAEYKEEEEEKAKGKLIRQERRYGKYSRSFNLGQDVDEENIKANFDNGVLSLVVPTKSRVQPASRQIPIK